MPSLGRPIRAAGGLLWREGPRGPELCLVHRPTHRDWTLPKGKLEQGEDWTDAAVREVLEETGSPARLDRFAGVACYWVGRRPKVVLYWSMTSVGEERFTPNDEIDALVWLPRAAALHKLTHAGERALVTRDGWLDGAAVAPPPPPHRPDEPDRGELPLALTALRRELAAQAASGGDRWCRCGIDLLALAEAALARGHSAEARDLLATARRLPLLGVEGEAAAAAATELRAAAAALPPADRRKVDDVLAAAPWPEALLFAAALRDAASPGHSP
jgi:8-oxo-dGTP diphosphatase